jgi:hypothetical protein
LAFDVPTLQLIAYSALTCASVFVASVSAIMGYHQNFGWKPFILLKSHGYGGPFDRGKDPPGVRKLTLEFEVWNRRKYPIVLLGAQIDFEKLDFVHTDFGSIPPDELWQHTGGRAFENYYSDRIEPNSYYVCKLGFAYKGQGIELDDCVRIKITYFDPNRNRYRTAKARQGIGRRARQAIGKRWT